MAKRIKNYELGFTLIELIIVMAVIAVLASIFLTSYPSSHRRARDTNRKSDLRQYQTALEVYANKNNGFYPSRTTSIQADTTLCSNLGLASCAKDPKDGQNVCTPPGQCRYYFRSDGVCAAGSACATNYFIYGRLEQPKVSTTPYWFVCSNGKSGEVNSVPGAGVACPVP